MNVAAASDQDGPAEGSPAGKSNASVVAAAAEVLGPLAEHDISLAPFCTYRVGGPAALFVTAHSIGDLAVVRRAVAASGCQTLVVGKGSNLLVADAGFPGIAVHLGTGFDDVTIDEEATVPEAEAEADELVLVRAGAAALLPVVARKTAAAGLTGFEWAVGVPGSIGGAVRMNAGGHGSDMAASLHRVGVFDLQGTEGPAGSEAGDIDQGSDIDQARDIDQGSDIYQASDIDQGGSEEPADWTVDELALAYRRSAIGPAHVVTSADLLLARGDAEAAKEEISEIVRWRREHQPGGQNAGSVFANPDGDSAGRVIDQLGLKGFRIGTAEVSTKHANFIQADPDGSADDVFRLIREIQLRVAAATSIELKVENRLIGFVEEDIQ